MVVSDEVSETELVLGYEWSLETETETLVFCSEENWYNQGDLKSNKPEVKKANSL
jgi:hypothetical protein